MTPTGPSSCDSPLRAAEPGDAAVDGLPGQLHDAIPWARLNPVAALSASSVSVAEGRAAEDLAGWLTADLGDLFTAAWLGHRDLRAAAEQTRGDPDTVMVVDLARQSVEVSQHAQLTVAVAGCDAASLALDLDVTGVVTALSVAVRDGCATEIRSGAAVLSSTLTLDRRTIWTHTSTLLSGLTRTLRPPRPLQKGPQKV